MDKEANALDVTITLSDQAVAGVLPLIPTRFRISTAFFGAVGWVEGDDSAPTGEPNIDDLAAVYAAAIGVCWPEPRPWPSLRAVNRDVIEYGEHVLHHLVLAGHSQQEVIREGSRLCRLVRHSVPTVGEVRETEEDFTGPVDSSTGTTVGSA